MYHKITNTYSGDNTSQISTMELEGKTPTDSILGDDASSLSPARKTSSLLLTENVKRTESGRRRMITIPKSSILKTHPNCSTNHCSTKTVSINHAKPTRSIEITKKKVVEKLIPQKKNNNFSGILKVRLKSEESIIKQNFTDIGCNTYSTVSISKRYDNMLQKKNVCVNSKSTQKSLPLQNSNVFSRGIQVFLRGPPTIIPAIPSINKSCYTYVRTADCGTQYINTALIDEIREKYKYSTIFNITHRPVFDGMSSQTNQKIIERQKRLIKGARRWNIPHSYEHMCFA